MDFLHAADGEGADEGAVGFEGVLLVGVPVFNSGVGAAWGVDSQGYCGFFSSEHEAVGVDDVFYFELFVGTRGFADFDGFDGPEVEKAECSGFQEAVGYEIVSAFVEQEVSWFDSTFGEGAVPWAEIGYVKVGVEREGAEADFHGFMGNLGPGGGSGGDGVGEAGAGGGLLGEVHAEFAPESLYGVYDVGGGYFGDEALCQGDGGDFFGREGEVGHGPVWVAELPGVFLVIEV